MHEVARFHDDAGTLLVVARRRVDLVLLVELEPCNGERLRSRVLGARRFATRLGAAAATPAPPAPSAAGGGLVLGGFLGGGAALLRGLFFQQRLPVRDRDLVIVGMDFGKG